MFEQLNNLIDTAEKYCRKNSMTEMLNAGFDKTEKSEHYISQFINNLEYNDYENLAWYAGYISGLMEAKEIVRHDT